VSFYSEQSALLSG